MIKWTGNNSYEIAKFVSPHTVKKVGNITGRGNNILAIMVETISHPGLMKYSSSIEIPEGDYVSMGDAGPRHIRDRDTDVEPPSINPGLLISTIDPEHDRGQKQITLPSGQKVIIN